VKSSLTVIDYPKLTRASGTPRAGRTHTDPAAGAKSPRIRARDSWLALTEASGEITDHPAD